MLSLNECAWDFQYNALWDTHYHALLFTHTEFTIINLLLVHLRLCAIYMSSVDNHKLPRMCTNDFSQSVYEYTLSEK